MKFRYREDHEMKDSGVEWIGKIPKDWELKRFGDFSIITQGYPFKSESFNSEGIGYPLIRIRDLFSSNLETYYNGEYVKSAEVVYGDILIGMDGDFNLTEWKGTTALLNQRVCKIQPKSINKDFYKYILVEPLKQINDLMYYTTVKHLSIYDIQKVRFSNPIYDEQVKIASFLDEKTSQFDSIISKKESLIKRLEEAKKSLISEVVTGKVKVIKTDDGFELVKRNDDEMKDSEVEWLGEIPKEWEVRKIKYVASLRSGDSITSDDIEVEGMYPVYGGNGLRGYTNNYTHEGTYILIGRQGALCGNINYAHNQFWASEHAVVVNPLLDVDLLWLGELLRSMNLNQYSVSAAQPGLAVGMIQNLSIPYTNIDEQKRISKCIYEKINGMEHVIDKTQQQIQKLKDAKQSLISEAVTGKIEILD